MKKIIITFLVLSVAMIGLKAQNAPNPLPIQFSTNTGDGAVWYVIKQDKNASNGGIKPWVPNGIDKAIGMRWQDPDPTQEDELYCFVGDNTNGFHIYNKAYLTGKTVGSITLTQDLKLQTIAARTGSNWWDGWSVGFTNGTPVSGDDLIDTFYLLEGNGTTHDGPARTGYYKIYAKKGTDIVTLSLTSQSEGTLLLNLDWGDSYNNQFLYVSGSNTPAEPTGEPAKSEGFPFKLSANTTDMAVWYYMLFETQWGMKPFSAEALESTLSVNWIDYPSAALPDGDKYLYCFIGDATNGVSIYNKAFLSGKTVSVNGGSSVTLSKDVPVQNLKATDWASAIGYSLNAPAGGATLVDKWFFTQGNGASIEGGVAKVGYWKISGNGAAWRMDGSSTLGWVGADWGSHYFSQYVWKEGQGVITGNDKVKTPANIKYYVKDRSIVLDNVEGVVTLTTLLGRSQKISAKGITSIPVNAAGVYILSINGISQKVLVK